MITVLGAMQCALDRAVWSPDPSTQNGACVITKDGVVSGFNHFPKGVEENEKRWERPLKYKYVEHAERDAIYGCACWGFSTMGATMVCPWAACSDCARGIVQAGISLLVRLPENNAVTAPHWHEDCQIGDQIMIEGGVAIVEMAADDIARLEIPELRRNGELWRPEVLV